MVLCYGGPHKLIHKAREKLPVAAAEGRKYLFPTTIANASIMFGWFWLVNRGTDQIHLFRLIKDHSRAEIRSMSPKPPKSWQKNGFLWAVPQENGAGCRPKKRNTGAEHGGLARLYIFHRSVWISNRFSIRLCFTPLSSVFQAFHSLSRMEEHPLLLSSSLWKLSPRETGLRMKQDCEYRKEDSAAPKIFLKGKRSHIKY